MRIIADLHIHSKYSRATSSKLIPSYLDRWARIKGINLVGTGDCTHPAWLNELKEQLESAEEGLYTLKQNLKKDFDSDIALTETIPLPADNDNNFPRFVLTGEISTIYSKDDKTRKIHHVVILPNFKAAADFQARLEKVGNIRSDGRPILGIDSRDLFEILLETDERSMLIPAHIWTPWFSALGAKSGFDSIDECYQDLSRYIYAIETGLSSNPPMNWAVETLDRFSIISNSDAHSPEKLGREATIMEMEMSYPSLVKALQRKGRDSDIIETIEFFPQEGKYHYDGHRNCNIYLSPEETILSEGICPVCKKPLIQGVMRRIMELADNKVDEEAPCPENYISTNRRPYRSLIPLCELLSEILETGVSSKKVTAAYSSIIAKAGSEFSLLVDLSLDNIKKIGAAGIPGDILADAIGRMRSGNVSITPGYDGEYGVIRAFGKGEKAASLSAPALFPDISENRSNIKKTKTDIAQKPEKKKIKEKHTTEKKEVFILNSEQEKIISHKNGHSIIIAGPGTGKTATLAYRIAGIIKNNKTDSILAVTFTVKAASELKERILKTVNNSNKVNIKTATFHSLCSSILREQSAKIGLIENFKITDDKEQSEILKIIIEKNKTATRNSKIKPQTLGKYIEEKKKLLLLPGEAVLNINSEVMQEFKEITEEIGYSEFLNNLNHYPELDILYSNYRDYLKSISSLDFDDLIAGTVRLFIKYPEILSHYRKQFKYIFVDEYQDVNFAQYALIKLFAPDTKKSYNNISDIPELCVIGDPNQSIYGFRGSDKYFIDRFLKDYPDAALYRLTKSFRCAGPIINAAGSLINTELEGSNNEVNLYRFSFPSEKAEAEGIARRISRLIGGTTFFSIDSGTASNRTVKKKDIPDETDKQPEIYLKNLGECAILLRTIALSAPIEKALQNHGIPYQVVGEKLWRDEEKIKDIIYIIKDIVYETIAAAAQSISEKITDEARIAIRKELQNYIYSLPPKDIVAIIWKIIKDKNSIAKNIAAIKNIGNIKTDDFPHHILRLYNFAALYDDIKSFLDAIAVSDSNDSIGIKKDCVTIMTIHASKGLEFDHVFIAGVEEGILPFTLYENFKYDNKKQIEKIIDEEKRVLYVAMTRARYGLYLSHAKSRFFQGRQLENNPSRFLDKLENIVPKYYDYIPKEKEDQLILF